MRIRLGAVAVLATLLLPVSGVGAQTRGDVGREALSLRSSLGPGDVLLRGQSVMSPDGSYRLAFLPGGNLVLYHNLGPYWAVEEIWSAGTGGTGGDRLVMQHDGDLVMYSAARFGGGSVWSSGTAGFDGAELRLPEEGGATIRRNDEQLLWSAGLLPPDVGLAGRQHLVYDRRGEKMMAWLVESDGTLTDSYLVSGMFRNPPAGNYEIYSKSPVAYGWRGGSMNHMVRFAYGRNGWRIGFHAIPVRSNGELVQSLDQLGQSLSAGCVRQRADKAAFLYEWAPIGMPVVVLG
ncbi:MAG: L,D-transpeptidase family protein [bacterium]|nr:L,D-transpeptidase family protein [bacterium]